MLVVMRTMVVLVAVGGLGGIAVAQPAPPDPAPPESAAATLFDQGRNLLESGQPGPACEHFEASLKLEPGASGTILNLGLCNEALDRLATALMWFRRVQMRAFEIGEHDTEVAAASKTSVLAAKVPTLKIAFTHPAPTGTVVTVDGVVVHEIDYARIELDAGKHAVDIAVTNLPRNHQEVELVDGDARTITVPIAAPVAPGARMVVVDRGAEQRRLAYILGGVGGALLIGDIALGIVAKRRFDESDMLDTRDHWRDVMRYGGTAIFLAGGTAIAGGVWLYLHAPAKERVELAPAIGPDHVGVSISGKF